MRNDHRTWTCGCGARGTIVVAAADDSSMDHPALKCPRCGQAVESRLTRRAPRVEKQSSADQPSTGSRPRPLTNEEMVRCAEEWSHAQEHLGELGVMAESHWALDWADRLLAELRRRRRRAG